jgi:hypothetical protein
VEHTAQATLANSLTIEILPMSYKIEGQLRNVGYVNRFRKQSSLGHESPIQFEEKS